MYYLQVPYNTTIIKNDCRISFYALFTFSKYLDAGNLHNHPLACCVQ